MRRSLALFAALVCTPVVARGQPLPRGTSFPPPELEPPPPPAELAAGTLDPDVAALQAAAAREAERGVPDPGSYPARARWAALLPRLTAEVRYQDQSNRVVGLQGSGEVDYLRLAPGRTVGVRATWDLGHLVAAPGELQAASHATARARLRAEAVARVTRLHFERQKARVALLLEPPTDPLLRAQAELEVDRLGAEIDALTGGLAAGRRRRRPRWAGRTRRGLAAGRRR